MLPTLRNLTVRVLPALTLLPTLLADLQLRIVETVLSLDGRKTHATHLLNAAVLRNEQTAIFTGEDVAAVSQDVP